MNCGSTSNLGKIKGLFLDDPTLIVPVLSDTKAHWCVNRLSFAYIFNIHTHQELMLGFNHNDIYRFNHSVLAEFLHTQTYVYKKKYLYDLRHIDDIFDIEMMYWHKTNQRFTQEVSPIIRKYWSDFKEYPNINDFIPIMKHLEYCRDVKDKFLTQITNLEVSNSLRRYQKIADNLLEIEEAGIFTRT